MPRERQNGPRKKGTGSLRKERKPGSLPAHLGRLVRKLLGRPRAAPPSRPGEDEVFEHLWRTAAAASARGDSFSIHQPNVLLFQMGRVASSALEVALNARGFNCFHCHFLNHQYETSRLSRLFRDQPGFRGAAIDLKLLAKHTALNMLVRWYRSNDVAPERRLKVITLTRDPVDWYVSELQQRAGYRPRSLCEWYRTFVDADAEDSAAVGPAASELFRQVARLVVETRPSADLAAARGRGRALAMAMNPPQPFIASSFERCLRPLGWFDEQFTPLFDINVRTVSELAERGMAHRELPFADILIVRFEDLGQHLDAIARFVGLATFELPPRNVSSDKRYGAPILEAARSFHATEVGAAFRRELRQSEYGRACGYDRLSDTAPVG